MAHLPPEGSEMDSPREENTREELEAMEFASAAVTGTAIGRTLDSALQSLVLEDLTAVLSLPTQDDIYERSNSFLGSWWYTNCV